MAPSRPSRAGAGTRSAKVAKDPKEQLKRRGADLIRKVADRDRYCFFLEPVDAEGYSTVITRPMDLSTLETNLSMGVYRTPMELRTDLDLIWSNCCTFNADDSIYFREAVRLRAVAARFYDEFVRNLARDGVADQLRVPAASNAAPSSSHGHAQNPDTPISTEANPTHAHPTTTTPTSKAPTQPPQTSLHQTQLRRAKTNYETALAAVKSAEAHLQSTTHKAGLHALKSDAQIFKGPSAILEKCNGRDIQQHPSRYPILNNPSMRDRCASIPAAWRRIGRWHSPETMHTPFLSEDRARDVRYGRQYTKYVEKSAPMARRLLATILHPETVQENDRRIISEADTPVNRRLSVEGSRLNGVQDAECEIQPRKPLPAESASSRKRPRSKVNEVGVQANGVCAEGDESVAGKLLLEILGEEGLREARSNERLPEVSLAQPNKNAVSKMRGLLKNKGIDVGFVSGLVDEPAVKKSRADGLEESACAGDAKNTADNKLNDLLHANYQGMMNTLRLRAVRHSVNEAEREEVEDRERECAEHVAKGIALAVSKLPPRFVVHPLDAAACAKDLCQAIESSHPNLQTAANKQAPTEPTVVAGTAKPSEESVEPTTTAEPIPNQPTKAETPAKQEARMKASLQASKPPSQAGGKLSAVKTPTALKVAATPIAKTTAVKSPVGRFSNANSTAAKTPVQLSTKPPVKPKAPLRKRQRRRPPAKDQ